MMHGRGKSDFAIVAVKPANKAEHPAEQSAVEVTAAEPVERRAETKGNAGQQSTCRTQSRASVSQALERIRQTFAVVTRGKSRMRESCMYGSARGAPSNGRPYRDRWQALAASGDDVEIRGPCVSACTLIVAFVPTDRICFGEAASLQFHMAGHVNQEPSIDTARWMLNQYPQDIRLWIRAKGGVEEDDLLCDVEARRRGIVGHGLS